MALNTKVSVWILVGESDAGKSTLIGHLTSSFGPGELGIKPENSREFRNVLLSGGGQLKMYTRRTALQELHVTSADFIRLVKSKIEVMENKKPNLSMSNFNALICLRLLDANDCGPAHTYVSDFINEGWDIRSIVMLPEFDGSVTRYDDFGVPMLKLENKVIEQGKGGKEDRSLGLGIRVGKVRSHFGWA